MSDQPNTGTNTDSQTTADLDTILAGIHRGAQSLPSSLQPGYRPPMPVALQSRPYQLADTAPAVPTSDASSSSTTAPPTPTSIASITPGGNQPLASPTPPVPSQQQPPPPPPQAPAGPQALVRPQQPVPLQPAPRFQSGNQPGPWPQAFPNSPRFEPSQAPPLPGETPQETADLNRHLAHETGNRGNIMNDWAARNPNLYYTNGQTCQGYWQITNSTWRDGAAKAGVSTQQYPTAMTAPYEVQRRVALALHRAYGNAPWAVPPGAGERGDKFALAQQQPPPSQPRESPEWGRDPPQGSFANAPPRDFGPGPPGEQQPPGMEPQSGFGRVMSAVAPLLLAIGSLALRLPLSSAITAYGAMARAQQNGQREEYERNRTLHQDHLREVTAQQAEESRAASDAFSEYGNNPQGLQQRLAQIALQYNDPSMYRMAEEGRLNEIYQMQQKRDLLNQDLTKLHKAVDEEQQRRDMQADVSARDAQWDRENPNATPEQRAIAHAQHVGQAREDIGGKAGASETQGPTLNVIGADGKPTGQQVVRNRAGTGYLDPNTGQPVTLKTGETVQPMARPGQQKPAPTNPYVQPDQQQPGDVTAPSGGQDQEQQPEQQAPSDQGDQGAASQAPAGPVQTAAATAPAAVPTPSAEQPAFAPYQVAQAGAGVQPPPSTAQPAQPAQERAAPGMGPRMSRLTPEGQRLARDYAMNGNEALQDVDKSVRQPLIDAGQELRSQMEEAAQSGLTGKALDKRLHQIDPTFADYLKGVSDYTNDLPTPGRTGSTGGRIMALSIAHALNPNFSEQNLKAQQDFRRPGSFTQRTLSRAAVMAESARQVREYLKALPADPGLERWQRAWDQFVNNKLVGDHRYSDLFVALRQYIQEANVLVRGGQESVTETGEQLGTREGGGLFGGAPFAISGSATPGMILGLLKTDARNTIARIDNYRNQWRQQDGHGEMPGDDAGAYRTFKELGDMDVDKESGVASDSDIEKFLGR